VDQKATLGFTFRARIIKLRGCNFNFNVDSNNYEFYGIFECIILCHVWFLRISGIFPETT